MYRGKHEKITSLRNEYLSAERKLGRFAGRIALAATCLIPVADLTLSDFGTAKVLSVTQENIDTGSNAANHAITDGVVGTTIMAESIGFGLILSRRKKMQGAFKDLDEYMEERRAHMSKPRRALSKTLNAPRTIMAKVAEKIESVDKKIKESDSATVRALGNFAVDAGQVNAAGTSAVIMSETLAGNTPDLGRQVRLAGIVTGSWLGLAETVRAAYRGIPEIRPPMAAIGQTFETVVSVTNPIGQASISAVALGLGYMGWNIARAHEEKQQAEMPAELLPFPGAS